MFTLSKTTNFTPFGEFIISPIHYIIHYIVCQSQDYVNVLMTGLFAWISLTALSRIYLIETSYCNTCREQCRCCFVCMNSGFTLAIFMTIIWVTLVHESFLPSRYRNLKSPHRKAGIVVGTPLAEYIAHKPINIYSTYGNSSFPHPLMIPSHPEIWTSPQSIIQAPRHIIKQIYSTDVLVLLIELLAYGQSIDIRKCVFG